MMVENNLLLNKPKNPASSPPQGGDIPQACNEVAKANECRAGSCVGRTFLAVLGTLFVGLGAIGVFLPFLPTTPFLILAAACYARGSRRLHDRLLSNRTFGPIIRQWRQSRCMPRRAKLASIALVVVTFSLSIGFAADSVWSRTFFAIVGLGLVIFLIKIPSAPQ